MALTAAVDAFMAENPQRAMLVSYRGPDSIDGAMLTRVSELPGADAVRKELASYMLEIATALWVFDPAARREE